MEGHFTSRLTILLACALLGFHVTSMAQGTIVYGQGSDSLYYSGFVDGTVDLSITGTGSTDFTLVSGNGRILISSVGTAWIAPSGENKILMQTYGGASYVAGLSAGTLIGSSLSPGYSWYDNNTDRYGQACIGAQSDAGIIGLILNGTYYVGFDLYYQGANHYGWMQISDPFFVVYGQVLDWAYETSPNTPIWAGAVPEPSSLCFIGMGGAVGLFLLRRKGVMLCEKRH